jgi:hypothetical protein
LGHRPRQASVDDDEPDLALLAALRPRIGQRDQPAHLADPAQPSVPCDLAEQIVRADARAQGAIQNGKRVQPPAATREVDRCPRNRGARDPGHEHRFERKHRLVRAQPADRRPPHAAGKRNVHAAWQRREFAEAVQGRCRLAAHRGADRKAGEQGAEGGQLVDRGRGLQVDVVERSQQSAVLDPTADLTLLEAGRSHFLVPPRFVHGGRWLRTEAAGATRPVDNSTLWIGVEHLYV